MLGLVKLVNFWSEIVSVVPWVVWVCSGFNTILCPYLDIYEEPWWQPDKKINIQFDRDHLNRIITNLLKNAVQSIPDNRDPEIKVKLYQNNDIVYIEVEDNGAGIDEVISQKIFEPKFTTKTSGMGLGLPMVKNIIEVYQGSISFQTNINKGTIFKISFPKTNK